MTTNIDHVNHVVDYELLMNRNAPSISDVAQSITNALADAGLLMPVLPEPDSTDGLAMWMRDDPDLTITQSDLLGVSIVSEVNEQGGTAEISLTVGGARAVALALLAAADYAERKES